MGLDVSHDAWHGAYSAFHRFRVAIAKATGGDITMEGAALGSYFWQFGKGYSVETHPGMAELFDHSDCDGEIAPDICAKLANELEALLPKLDEADDGGGHLGDVGEVARRFIAGCRDAAAAGEPLDFH